MGLKISKWAWVRPSFGSAIIRRRTPIERAAWVVQRLIDGRVQMSLARFLVGNWWMAPEKRQPMTAKERQISALRYDPARLHGAFVGADDYRMSPEQRRFHASARTAVMMGQCPAERDRARRAKIRAAEIVLRMGGVDPKEDG
tara:strand:- start:320 stop:748 length:429 start_codon:yes stop_codon:yes gene_type:complete